MPLFQARAARAVTLLESSFSRSYGRNLPSSLTIVHPITLVFSTSPPELVWGTGTHVSSLAAFLDSVGSVTSPESARLHVSGFDEGRTYLDLSLHAYPRTTIAWAHLPCCVPALLASVRWVGSSHPPNRWFGHPLSNPTSAWARTWWYRNINRLCIDYACRPRLSSRLTLGGLAFPRNPWTSGGGVSHPSFATHTCIRTRPRSTTVHTGASTRDRRSATMPVNRHPQFRLRT